MGYNFGTSIESSVVSEKGCLDAIGNRNWYLVFHVEILQTSSWFI
jgi:hypothetical protein